MKLSSSADEQPTAHIKQVLEEPEIYSNHLSATKVLYHWEFWEVEQDRIPWQPQDIFRDMHQGLKDVEVKGDGFSESVGDLIKVCSPTSPSSHSEMGAMTSKPRKIICLVGTNLAEQIS